MNSKLKGFTLIELILVILVLAIVSTGIVTFIQYGVQTYQDTAGRDKQISDSRFLIERITRELQDALPNSVRVTDSGNCIEFVPILASSSYVDIPVLPEASANTAELVVSGETFNSVGTKLVVYPLATGEVYVNSDAITGKVFSVTGYSTPPVNNVVTATLHSNVRFDEDSPTQRYFIIKDSVAYCWDSSGDIRRFQGHSLTAGPQTGTGVLMAERVVKLPGGNDIFTFDGDNLLRNAIVLIDITMAYSDENLRIVKEVNVPNVP